MYVWAALVSASLPVVGLIRVLGGRLVLNSVAFGNVTFHAQGLQIVNLVCQLGEFARRLDMITVQGIIFSARTTAGHAPADPAPGVA